MIRIYGVASPTWDWIDYIPGLGDGPRFTERDFLYVRARSRGRAKALALRAWRRRGSRFLEDLGWESPFTGMEVEDLTEHFP